MDQENDYTISNIENLLPSDKDQKKIEKLMRLALKIKKAIKSKGWTKTKFAEEMGIKNPSIVTKWLSGTNNFEATTLIDIGDLLGINLLNASEQSYTSASYEAVYPEVVISAFIENKLAVAARGEKAKTTSIVKMDTSTSSPTERFNLELAG